MTFYQCSGSASGYGSEDPDPCQNVTDLQHWPPGAGQKNRYCSAQQKLFVFICGYPTDISNAIKNHLHENSINNLPCGRSPLTGFWRKATGGNRISPPTGTAGLLFGTAGGGGEDEFAAEPSLAASTTWPIMAARRNNAVKWRWHCGAGLMVCTIASLQISKFCGTSLKIWFICLVIITTVSQVTKKAQHNTKVQSYKTVRYVNCWKKFIAIVPGPSAVNDNVHNVLYTYSVL